MNFKYEDFKKDPKNYYEYMKLMIKRFNDSSLIVWYINTLLHFITEISCENKLQMYEFNRFSQYFKFKITEDYSIEFYHFFLRIMELLQLHINYWTFHLNDNNNNSHLGLKFEFCHLHNKSFKISFNKKSNISNLLFLRGIINKIDYKLEYIDNLHCAFNSNLHKYNKNEKENINIFFNKILKKN